jgi:hypothetical protein
MKEVMVQELTTWLEVSSQQLSLGLSYVMCFGVMSIAALALVGRPLYPGGNIRPIAEVIVDLVLADDISPSSPRNPQVLSRTVIRIER